MGPYPYIDRSNIIYVTCDCVCAEQTGVLFGASSEMLNVTGGERSVLVNALIAVSCVLFACVAWVSNPRPHMHTPTTDKIPTTTTLATTENNATMANRVDLGKQRALDLAKLVIDDLQAAQRYLEMVSKLGNDVSCKCFYSY